MSLFCYILKLIIINFLIYKPCLSWEADDYELFDIIEEVNKNFYDVLNITQDASSGELRKAYHRLSLKLHPDHNEDPEAETQFRQLVQIYDVLRDEVKRQKYDQVLKVGLPNWRNPSFYYRKVRKLGLLEITTILISIFTLGHYIILWSVYLERKYEIEDVLSSKLKRRDKKLKGGRSVNDSTYELITEKINELPKPSYRNLFPFLIIGGLKSLILSTPLLLEFLRTKFQKKEDDINDEDFTETEDALRKSRRKKVLEIPEFAPSLNKTVEVSYNSAKEDNTNEIRESEVEQKSSQRRTNVWSEKDIAALTKMMNRYPSGTSRRWEKIADDLQRNVKDVTEMVKSLKGNSERKSVSAELQGLTSTQLSDNMVKVSDVTVRDTSPLVETSRDDVNRINADGCSKLLVAGNLQNSHTNDSWNQVQQKALEEAIAKFPRSTEERWEKIAACIPNKSKEDCFKRYKYLVEKIKIKKQK